MSADWTTRRFILGWYLSLAVIPVAPLIVGVLIGVAL